MLYQPPLSVSLVTFIVNSQTLLFGVDMKPLHTSPYSFYFLALRYLGSWLYNLDDTEKESPLKLNGYILYRLLVTGLTVYSLYCLFVNFYMVLGDVRKMTWNLGITMFIGWTLCKSTEMLIQRDRINSLRVMLHRDAESRIAPEDVSINEIALKEMKGVCYGFYVSTLFIPVWIATHYIGRELPLPFALPDFVDMDNDDHFNAVFFFVMFVGAFFLLWALEMDLAMYSLLVQISREYRVLLKDIRQINLLYWYDDEELYSVQSAGILFRRKEVNPVLRRIKTKMLLKRFSDRQTTLIMYTKLFEQSFTRIFFNQFFGLTLVTVVLGLQLLWDSFVLSGYLVYQIAYMYISILNMFLMCWWPTVISSQCLDVGERFYSSLWYRMDGELQRDISMIIMRSQNPPKITAWNFMEMRLSAFMNTMRHIYGSWACFKQLG